MKDPQDPGQGQKDRQVQGQGQSPNDEEGLKDALPQPGHVPSAELDGKVGRAAHTQPQENRGQEGHEGVGGAHRRQGGLPQNPAHQPGVRQVVELLEEVAADERKGKQEEPLGDTSLGQVPFHPLFSRRFFSVAFKWLRIAKQNGAYMAGKATSFSRV